VSWRGGHQSALPRVCRFYAGEAIMALLAITAALAALASATRWTFAIFLTLQGRVPNPTLILAIFFCHALKPRSHFHA